jgi:hypothetical protein
MRKRTLNYISVAISTLALAFSAAALYLSYLQHAIQYDRTIKIAPGLLPIPKIGKGPFSFDLEVQNTSKRNIDYYLQVETNMGCISGKGGVPVSWPCTYKSQQVSLGNMDASKNTYKHTFKFDAVPGAIDTHPLALISPPDYFLRVEVFDATNDRLIYRSKCFYSYQPEALTFSLDQPVTDSTGNSARQQQECRA